MTWQILIEGGVDEKPKVKGEGRPGIQQPFTFTHKKARCKTWLTPKLTMCLVLLSKLLFIAKISCHIASAPKSLIPMVFFPNYTPYGNA